VAGKPVWDYDDPQAREASIDALAKDARALLGALDGREFSPAVAQAAVVRKDLDEGLMGCSGSRAGSPRTGSSVDRRAAGSTRPQDRRARV
jgi:hypothetical protein